MMASKPTAINKAHHHFFMKDNIALLILEQSKLCQIAHASICSCKGLQEELQSAAMLYNSAFQLLLLRQYCFCILAMVVPWLKK
jgi:hypothetical protein